MAKKWTFLLKCIVAVLWREKNTLFTSTHVSTMVLVRIRCRLLLKDVAVGFNIDRFFTFTISYASDMDF